MKKPFKDIFWYLEQVGGIENFYFSTHDEAYAFGHAVRRNEGDKVDVEIGADHVRIKLVEQEATVRSSK
jgi:hypothetical protein